MRNEMRVLSIREKAYLYIQELISNGSLVAGSSISELLLAKNLGSSRTPVREAMNQLASQCLLTQSPGGGMVAQPTRDDIIDLYEMREALEVYAVGNISRRPLRLTDKLRLQQLVDEWRSLRKRFEKLRNLLGRSTDGTIYRLRHGLPCFTDELDQQLAPTEAHQRDPPAH